MKISTDHKEDIPFTNIPSSGYEWWYFDAISNDGEWSFVVIFYIGNPFSPEYIQNIAQHSAKPDAHPAVSISVYHRSKAEFYSFVEYTETDLKWDEEKEILKIHGNTFSKITEEDVLIYQIRLNEKLESSHSISAQIEFKSRISNPALFKESDEGAKRHFWNLVQPKADVKGNILIKGKTGSHQINFKGLGYHDHNVGLEPMKDDFIDWYWGRLHFEKFTLIYYVMNRKKEQQHRAWLVSSDNQKVLDKFDKVETEDKRTSLFGISSARKIILKSKNSEVTIQANTLIDSGPFYQRYISKALINRNNELTVAEGITEFIYPKNIYKKLYWPAVRMRLRFNQKKPHWVQKFKMFYEWTW